MGASVVRGVDHIEIVVKLVTFKATLLDVIFKVFLAADVLKKFLLVLRLGKLKRQLITLHRILEIT